MQGKVGISTRYGVVIPGLRRLRDPVSLSKEAKLRLAWVDFYLTHGKNARLTCRHFGIHHRSFYRYYQRFQKLCQPPPSANTLSRLRLAE